MGISAEAHNILLSHFWRSNTHVNPTLYFGDRKRGRIKIGVVEARKR